MFEVIVKEVNEESGETKTVVRYQQIVDVIDLRAVMFAVNKKPRKSRAKGAQAEQSKSTG